MSAWEYRSKAETLMAEYRFLAAGELADELAEAGYIITADRDAVAEAITDHDGVYVPEGDEPHCKCGKWLEDDEYEWPDHMGDVLERWITEAGESTP
ncbi:hypothetical protein [Nocardia nova]|uniref:hypothetical protein n=1 Tax=Nocardia nova TaxID=37330 RepID=UPI00273850F7|nr:hypothetical protein [Nocardia nova]